MKPVPWSYSRLTSFETCPRRYFRLSVQKDIKEEQSQAIIDGNTTHKAFELRIRDGKQLPIHLRVHEPMLAAIVSSPGEKIVEQQIALSVEWQPVEWFAPDVWLRVKSDLTQYKGDYGIVWDWKTGRPHEDFTQLKLNAAVLLLLAPEIETIIPAYYWTKQRRMDTGGHRIKRADVPEIWGPILTRVAEYQRAHEEQNFPPKQNYFCKGCPVKDCQYWRAK